MATSLERNLTLGAIAAGTLLLLMTVLAVGSTRGHQATADSIAHAERTVVALETMRAALLGAESSTRAYLLTGNPEFLVAAAEDRQRVDGTFEQLRQFTAGSDAQRARIDALRESVRLRFDLMERAQRVRDELGATGAAALLARGDGQDATAGPPGIDDLRAAETSRLTGLVASSESSVALEQTQLAALAAAGMLVLAGAYWLLRRRLRSELGLARKLHSTEARLQPLIANMPDGLVTTTETGRIESMNPAAERIFGYAADELVGRSFKRLLAVPEGDDEVFLQSVPRHALGRASEWDGRRKDGSTFPLELTLFTFETESGLRYAADVRDVSERREIDRVKNELIAVVSHELRTPLTSIQGSLQLVLAENPAFSDSEHATLLTVALDNCARLTRTISDILDVSKIESGHVELRLRPCAVTPLLDAAVEGIAASARGAGITVVVDVEPDIPDVRGDFERLVQVLVNVLSNAVKFSPAGTTVVARAERQERFILLSIRDQGRGIREEDLDRIFGKFQQIDSSATRRVGGTGLGLAIVKAIVERHKGTVRVDSRYGEGTTVVLTLPGADDTPVPAGTAAGLRAAVQP